MPLEIAKKLWTVNEVLRMQETGILTPDNRLELICGELIEMSPSGNRHRIVVNCINKLLNKLIGEAYTIWVQTPITLNELSAPEPDIALLKWKGDFYSPQPPGPEDILLIIEVADSSLSFDRTIKASLYAEFGIPEYWILNLQEPCLEQYQLPGKDGYARITRVSIEEKLELPGLGQEIIVGQLLGVS